MMTLQTLMSEATALVGGRLDMTPSQVSLYVNMAQMEVARAMPHGEMETTTYLSVLTSAATAAGYPPSDFDAPIALSRLSAYDTLSHLAMTRVSIGEIDDAADSSGTGTGTSNRYAIHGDQLFVCPKSSSAISVALRYRKVPTEMTATTDVPSIHTRYQPAILYKTAESLAMRSVNPELAAYYRNTFISYMQATPSTQELRSGAERQNTER